MAVLTNILYSNGLPAILIVFLSISGSPKNKTSAEATTDSIVMAILHENVCLKCPVLFSENTGLIWRLGFNQSYLFRGEARTYDNRNFPLTINECDSMHYALGLLNVAIGVNDVRYTCWRKDQLISSFVVHIQVTPTMEIVGESVVVNTDTSRTLSAIEGVDVEIQCAIFNTILPLNVTWLQNGVYNRTDIFTDVTKLEMKNLTSNLKFKMRVNIQNFTCKVNGRYVVNQESEILIHIQNPKSITPDDTSGLRSQRMGTTERTNVTAATFETINMSEEVQYESPDDIVGEFYFYGDNTVLNRGDIILTSSLPCTGRMKRWIASTKGNDRSLIVANTLCDTSANEDWLQIRLLAEHLRHIPKHRNVVEIVAADTVQIPYYIYTEYITNGTLRDVLCKAKYDDVYSKTIYMQGLSRSAQSSDALRIGSFLLEPLKALFFLESIDCDHPAICSRKVLLTPNMVCKLYDFNLRSATKKMLSNIKFEESLSLPWFAPETIFKKHYDRESDVWSFAVFIWEIFSQGASPFDGLDIMKFADQPDALPVLSKPDLCSDSLYAIMTSCLKVDPADRISLTALKTKLFQLIENID
ncbi:fibroblast growth factor receptor 2-like isoform X2 [Apostichopus japonicus]|uniref:fibroblast growth factor receptor 2-like isoform X2 n=1 Tax=Stichopus japonicus TaxID=307972 RepID=UPI003AB25F92